MLALVMILTLFCAFVIGKLHGWERGSTHCLLNVGAKFIFWHRAVRGSFGGKVLNMYLSLIRTGDQ